jgi:hypothetical protein
MPIYEIKDDELVAVPPHRYDAAGIYERRDLQKLLREKIDAIAPGTLVIAEEFGDWEDSKRRIDLLALDGDANLVVIELKRDETGAHMELQAVRYAAMVSTMTFEQAVHAYSRFRSLAPQDVEAEILRFLEWETPDEESFAQDVRVVLASAEFSKELATSVLWLNERGLDIRCIRMRPYSIDGRIVIDIQQVIPLPEAEEYQVRIREKSERAREAREAYRDFTRYDLSTAGGTWTNLRKRRLIFEVVRQAIHAGGATPDSITSTLSRKGLWAIADGLHQDQETFVQSITMQYAAMHRPFDPGRWFVGDDELFRDGGRTYAFTKMWGGEETLRAVSEIKDKYPLLNIHVRPVGAS